MPRQAVIALPPPCHPRSARAPRRRRDGPLRSACTCMHACAPSEARFFARAPPPSALGHVISGRFLGLRHYRCSPYSFAYHWYFGTVQEPYRVVYIGIPHDMLVINVLQQNGKALQFKIWYDKLVSMISVNILISWQVPYRVNF